MHAQDKDTKKARYFSQLEILLWGGSAALILLSFLLFDRENYLALCASLLGVTSLIYCAKLHPLGQLLMVLFSLLYGVISYSFSYYGEMITYLGMTAPMALFSFFSWLRHPSQGRKAETAVAQVRGRETALMLGLAALVTLLFYFILAYFHTANLLISTLSVTASFIAVYLTFRRSPFYALAYAANDVILIILWILASMEDGAYLSVAVCFCVFLINDIYGFFSWKKAHRRQQAEASAAP